MINIWQRYGQKLEAYFFGPPCILCVYIILYVLYADAVSVFVRCTALKFSKNSYLIVLLFSKSLSTFLCSGISHLVLLFLSFICTFQGEFTFIWLLFRKQEDFSNSS